MQNFTIFKVKDHNGDEKKPTHSISAKIGEEFVYIGRCWTKDGNNGKFLSCSLDKPYQDKPGYTIEVELPESQKNNAHKEGHEHASPTAFDDDFNPEDSPF